MGVPALAALRALHILEYFEKVRSPLTLKAITTHLDLPSSSTAALLKALASLDYLSYDVETRTYLPTLRLASLGDWVPNRIMEDGVLDLVGRLRERLPETIVITTLNDLFIDFIDFNISRRYAEIFSIDETIKYPRGGVAVTCPMGWCLLKDYKISRLERIYYRSLAKRLFDKATFTWEMFLNRVESARQSKYIVATDWPYRSTAVVTTTVPVLPFGRHVALGVGAPLDRMKANLPALLDLLDAELGQFTPLGATRSPVDGNIRHRVTEIDAGVGALETHPQ